jgi:hypothetical protein
MERETAVETGSDSGPVCDSLDAAPRWTPTHQDLFSAIYQHAKAIVKVTEAVPAACRPMERHVGPLGWTVEEFLEDGLATCRQQIATRVGEDREGWIKDEWYWIELQRLIAEGQS